MPHLSLHPTLRTCSSDTILRGISELATANTTYTSDTGKSYDFKAGTSKMSDLLEAQLLYQQSLDRRTDAFADHQNKLLEYRQATGQ